MEAGKPPKFITALHSFAATHCSGCACEFPARWHGSKKKDSRVLRGSQQIITTGGGVCSQLGKELLMQAAQKVVTPIKVFCSHVSL